MGAGSVSIQPHGVILNLFKTNLNPLVVNAVTVYE